MAHAAVAHRTVEVDGTTIFYREAGPADAPVVLLPHGYPDRLTDRVSPDLWRLSWAQVGDPERRANLVRLLADQGSTVAWSPRQQEYLRTHEPPTLIVWGPHDGYMPEGAARAHLRDLPDAELNLLDGGHWLLESHLDEVVRLLRDFLGRVHP